MPARRRISAWRRAGRRAAARAPRARRRCRCGSRRCGWPCVATGRPAAATTTAAAVETFERAHAVAARAARVHDDGGDRAGPGSSPRASPARRRKMVVGVPRLARAAPPRSPRSAPASTRPRRSRRRPRAAWRGRGPRGTRSPRRRAGRRWRFMSGSALGRSPGWARWPRGRDGGEPVVEELHAGEREDRLGVELHALDGVLAVAQRPMISPSAVQAETSRDPGSDARSTRSEWVARGG